MDKRIFLRIPMGDPYWDYRELLCIFKQAIRSTNLQTEVKELEARICDIFGVQHCMTTDLGRPAIVLALKGLGLKEGDGVILPSFVCQTVILPILSLGCVPQFADIGDDLNISPESVERTINSKTRAIIMPHLFGKAAPAEEILKIARNHNLFVIDDAAQAMGARYNGRYVGTMGDVGIFSFGPFKGVMATRGGALVTNSEEIYQKVKRHLPLATPLDRPFVRGMKSLVKFKFRKYSHSFFCANNGLRKPPGIEKPLDFSEMIPSRMSPTDAAIALVQLDKFGEIIKRRSVLGIRLSGLLEECDWLNIPGERDGDHVFVKYVVRPKVGSKAISEADDRIARKLIKYLRKFGIEAQNTYRPLHLNKHFREYCSQPLKKTEHVWQYLVALPVNPCMSFENLKYMASCIRKFGRLEAVDSDNG